MSKALVIKGANFSTNKVTTISFREDIPCTGITLNHDTLSVSYAGTESLTATPAPANTTDSVVWSTSNSNVATVSNGTISAVGIGTATITATCGEFSASCVVTSTAAALSGTQVTGARINGTGVADSGNGLGCLGSASKFGTIASSTGTYHTYIYDSSIEGTYYPNIIPNNTKKLKITVGGNVSYAFLGLYNKDTQKGDEYPNVATLIKRYGDSDLEFTNNVCEFEIPTYNGQPTIDAFIISYKSSTIFTSSDYSNCSVEFIADTGS